MKSKLLMESGQIRDEAKKLLDLTGIESYLKKYGEVNLIGSYTYDVMLALDIDFHIIIKEFNTNLVKDFFDYTINSGLFEEIIFHDKHKFNKEAAARYASKKALDSYYFGLRTTFEEKSWQIGVNFITEPQQAAVEIGKLFDNVTDQQREQILVFKNKIAELGYKVSSAYIYRAVIEKNINQERDLWKYLESIGYVFNK